MAFNGKLRKYGLISSFAGGAIAILIAAIALNLFNPLGFRPIVVEWDGAGLIEGSASTFKIESDLTTNFGDYSPFTLSYEPKIDPTPIRSGLSNVDLQGITLSADEIQYLETYGFVLVDEGYEDIYDIYEDNSPKFITTDLCLHAYHVLYDISLRVLEGTHFGNDFQIMLQTLRDDQLSLYGNVAGNNVKEALLNNIAYLTVMLYLIDNSTLIPSNVNTIVSEELANIDEGVRADSAIFGYEEDYTQYKVRGHYTRNDFLGRYFKAMMYAGRMGFLLQGPQNNVEMGIEHTRMALLLLSSFNSSISLDSEMVWDYWDRIYEPTVFYVGSSDDLTALEYYQIWKSFSSPQGDQLEDDDLISDIISEAQAYRKPMINSMLIFDTEDHENVTQGFRLMGQRFIPDSYIFQQLVHDKVGGRLFPNGLDVFSVFGSSRAAFHLQEENQTYPDYDSQIQKLREEFGNLTDYDWTQNLYWLWLYSLFPLLESPTDGYPGFMLNTAWLDKTLMTALGSWAELRHDTILYAKQSYTYETSIPPTMQSYVEPYPELYARLSSLVHLMKNGLESRGLTIEGFSPKLVQMADIFDRLVELSIKELENKKLNESDLDFIGNVGKNIAEIASFDDPSSEPWINDADNRTAIIADVHTDPNTGKVLEVGTGNPFVIYAVVQDYNGELYLTRGGTFSYYEFKQAMENRLTDEEWHEMLDSNPPDLPGWISESLPIVYAKNDQMEMIDKED
jgi:hypothetical protein